MSNGVLLITGAGRGLGSIIARQAGQQGWLVVVNYFTSENAAVEVVDSINSFGGKAIGVKADVSSAEEVKEMFDVVDKNYGQLNGLVNNAALVPNRKAFLKTEAEEDRKILETNLLGPILCIKEAAARMSIKNGGSGGAVVNVSSESAAFGGKEISCYAASKGGLNSLTIGLARELAPEGIRVNAVSLGIIDINENSSSQFPKEKMNRESLPMGRAGKPEEVANVVLWLLSKSSNYVGGAIVPVSGAR